MYSKMKSTKTPSDQVFSPVESYCRFFKNEQIPPTTAGIRTPDHQPVRPELYHKTNLASKSGAC